MDFLLTIADIHRQQAYAASVQMIDSNVSEVILIDELENKWPNTCIRKS